MTFFAGFICPRPECHEVLERHGKASPAAIPQCPVCGTLMDVLHGLERHEVDDAVRAHIPGYAPVYRRSQPYDRAGWRDDGP
jgi:hypothetical protein